jgi:hypothetical protein
MADFIFFIFIPPVLLFMYYVGFITMTKLKMKQPDDDKKTHLLRAFWGFVVFAVVAFVILTIKWLFFSSKH